MTRTRSCPALDGRCRSCWDLSGFSDLDNLCETCFHKQKIQQPLQERGAYLGMVSRIDGEVKAALLRLETYGDSQTITHRCGSCPFGALSWLELLSHCEGEGHSTERETEKKPKAVRAKVGERETDTTVDLEAIG